MKNKTIALLGIGSYVVGVITSATDIEGAFVFPIGLIVGSGLITIMFTVLATVRLWQEARHVAIILASSAVILFILSVIQDVVSPSYGSPIIILLNVTKVINFIAFVWAIVKLFKMTGALIVNQHGGTMKDKLGKECR